MTEIYHSFMFKIKNFRLIVEKPPINLNNLEINLEYKEKEIDDKLILHFIY